MSVKLAEMATKLAASRLMIRNAARALDNDDVKKVAVMVLRHRIILNYEGQAEEINVDDVITELLQKVPVT